MKRRSLLKNRCGCGSCGVCSIFRRRQVIAAAEKTRRCRRDPGEVYRTAISLNEDADLEESPEAALRFAIAERVYRATRESAAPFRTITTFAPWGSL